MDSFIWKGASSLEKNIYIKNALKLVPRAEKKVEKIEIPGRNGCLFADTESYRDISYTIECNTKKNADMNDIKQWLLGSGELVLSNQPDVFYKGYIYNQLDIETMVRFFKSFQVQFILQPFAYSLEKYIKKLEGEMESSLIITDATEKMYPILNIYGNEEVNITINKQSLVVHPQQYITIDCEMLEAYKDNQNANSKVLGDIGKIALNPGRNEIYIVGNYDKIEIEYRKVFL